ncbi:MAG: DNA mismatch repair protein MutS, partial [Elusimicrobiota bacterium]
MKQIEIPETPLMQQYQSLKNSYPNAVLFFRLGDFYEMFYEDARVANRTLGLVLTSRQEVPMCGVPFHSVSNYISKLLKAGHKVAICEQIAPRDDSKKTKLFKREVVRLITPGTIIEDELLQTKNSNYLTCVEIDIVGWGLSYIEASTGEFFSTQCLNDPWFYQLSSLVSRLAPSEIIGDTKTITEFRKRNIFSQKTTLTEYLKITDLDGSEWKKQSVWQNHKLALKTALNVISYVKENQPGLKDTFIPSYFEILNKMQMDESAIRTLELVETQDIQINSTLWGVLDNAKTAMGSRLLKKWVLEPLIDIQEIHKRQNFVAMLVDNSNKRADLAEILQEVPDVERILGRVLNLSVSPRDISAIRKALGQIPKVKMFLSSISSFEPVSDIASRIESVSVNLESLKDLLQKAIVDSPPAKISDGGVIRENFNSELDELRNLRKNSQKLLIEIEAKEREKTQIPSLKVRYNSVFGYYIEVTKPHLSKVPNYYVRKQTLVNAERFITQELKELESKILGAEERMLKLEFHLFAEIKEILLKNLKELRTFALCVSELDAFYGLSVSAVLYDYVRPEISLDDDILIE